jgi:hypothetical protein
MRSKAIAVWLGIAAVLVVGTATVSTARAQAQRKEGDGATKVWGYYRIVETERCGDGKVLVKVLVRLINRGGENYSLNTMRMLGPSGGFYAVKAVGGAATAMASGVTTVKQQFTVSVDDTDKLREASRLALVLSVDVGERVTKTVTAVLQRDAGIREEN